MTLPNPIDININAVDKDLIKINMDGYGSHYRLLSTTERIDLKIRHVAEKPNAAGIVMDRHAVDLTHTIFSTDPDVADDVVQAYCILRNASRNVGTQLPYLAVALADLMKESGFIADLVGWQN